MIDVSQVDLYEAALAELRNFKQNTGGYRGRFVQLFLALKFYQSDLPSVQSGQAVPTGTLQEMIDDLFAKDSRPDHDSVLMMFEHRYVARTGVVAPGNTYPTNTWRNNFNLQKGVGCFASEDDLVDLDFLNEPRIECRHLVAPGPEAEGLRGCTCSLASSNPQYRGEEHRKWLQIKGDGAGYAVINPTLIPNYEGYVVPAEGSRLPLVPVVIALYHDVSPAMLTGKRRGVNTFDFASDFNFSLEELRTYFDDSADNVHNRALTELETGLEWDGFGEVPAPPRPEHEDELPEAEEDELPTAILGGTPAQPPAVNPGFEPERFVAQLFVDAGWQVEDVSRQQVGYDLHVSRKGRGTLYIEVKSSVGSCRPVLTAREWQQAKRRGDEYVLAVVENFDPKGENFVHWVRGPASRCRASESTTIQYSLPRSSWSAATVGFPIITGEAEE